MNKIIKRFIATADWHIGLDNSNRIDDVKAMQQRSVEEIFQFAVKHKVDMIFHAGDFFDKEAFDYRNEVWFFALCNKYGISHENFCMIPGNHEIFQKNPKFIERSQVNVILTIFEASYDNIIKYPFGAIMQNDPAEFTILHRYTDIPIAKTLVKDLSASKWIISGDNHEHFVVVSEDKKTTLLNCGSLVRCTINEPLPKFFYVDEGAIYSIDLPDTSPTAFKQESNHMRKAVESIMEQSSQRIDGVISTIDPISKENTTYEEYMYKHIDPLFHNQLRSDMNTVKGESDE